MVFNFWTLSTGGKYSSGDIKVDGEEYLIMREDEILGIVEHGMPQQMRQPPTIFVVSFVAFAILHFLRGSPSTHGFPPGLKAVAAGVNPMAVKRSIDKAVVVAVEEVKTFSKPVSGEATRSKTQAA